MFECDHNEGKIVRLCLLHMADGVRKGGGAVRQEDCQAVARDNEHSDVYSTAVNFRAQVDDVHYQEIAPGGYLDLHSDADRRTIDIAALDPIDTTGLSLPPALGESEALVEHFPEGCTAIAVLALFYSKVERRDYLSDFIDEASQAEATYPL